MADTDMADRPNGRRSPTRSPTPRSTSRNSSPSRSPSRSRSRSRSNSRGRNRRTTRSLTRSPTHSSRSPSPPHRSTKIVIEKLTKNIHPAHLHEIFSLYGPIADLEMPMNRQFLMNKGIAYILYTSAKDAEEAIACMHEAQLDGACINVSIVLPRRRFSRSPPGKRPPLNRFGEPHRLRDGPGAGGGGGGGRGPPPMSSDHLVRARDLRREADEGGEVGVGVAIEIGMMIGTRIDRGAIRLRLRRRGEEEEEGGVRAMIVEIGV
ncbi:hypothetical protein D0866_03997 [Hortaea werneckii]|uniref:RRM domain-containing protein n=1 Tax=Hortaea werneckii TaxID=91943 RepID=A0A3M7B928_HORWE|nr:hypothetical protein D0866_03997 [Hortaea werneckii]